MKILLGDDHRLFVEGISAILRNYRPDIIVDCVYHGGDVVSKTCSDEYDLVLLDLRLPELNGFDVLEQLQHKLCLTPVIVLSASENPTDMKRAASLGARGFLSKKCSAQQIFSAIDRVMLGEVVFVESGQPNQLIKADQQNWCNLHGITPRQLEVLRLMKHGLTNSSIAENLCISQATVKTHVAAIFKAFNSSSRSESVSKAQLLGLD